MVTPASDIRLRLVSVVCLRDRDEKADVTELPTVAMAMRRMMKKFWRFILKLVLVCSMFGSCCMGFQIKFMIYFGTTTVLGWISTHGVGFVGLGKARSWLF